MGITPTSIVKPRRERLIEKVEKEEEKAKKIINEKDFLNMSPKDRKVKVREFELRMKEAAEVLDFEVAARYRDIIRGLKKLSADL